MSKEKSKTNLSCLQRWQTGVWVFASVLFANLAIATPAVLQQMQWDEGQQQLVLTLDKKATFSLFSLVNPMRVVIDLVQTRLGMDPVHVAKANTPIKQIRVSAGAGGDLRIVLDLQQNVPGISKQQGVSQQITLPLTAARATGSVATPVIQTATAPVAIPVAQASTMPVAVPVARTPTQAVTVPKTDPQISKLEWDKLVMLAEQQNNAVAQNQLGTLYYQGKQVQENKTLAVTWFSRAADQGLAEAQHNLGILYSKGLGVGRDYQKALLWLSKAAAQGLAKAEYNLAVMYLQGLGTAKDSKKAFDFLRRAAKDDHPKAQYLLGILYTQGIGVQKSFIKGYAWLIVAKRQGMAEADKVIAVLERSMTKSALSNAKTMAEHYYKVYHTHNPKKLLQ